MPSDTRSLSLSSVPQEVLEHIAFFAATDGFLGPPSGILPFLALSRSMHAALSFDNNPHLYARIFIDKFDYSSALRRLGVEQLSATALASELRRRSLVLKRIRRRLDSKTNPDEPQLLEVLWCAYLMVLESDGKNERQLREYALMDEWLKEFWFASDGASGAIHAVCVTNRWPRVTESVSLALWLFWFLLKPDEYVNNEQLFRDATGILKVIALAAHHYPLANPDWVDFVPRQHRAVPTVVKHFSSTLRLAAPAASGPAILAYLTLVNKPNFACMDKVVRPLFPPADSESILHKSEELDCDWARIRAIADPKLCLRPSLSGAFIPGSFEGVWEGIFTYTEFTSYAALLTGAPPGTLLKSLVAQHRQTIKVREWHFLEPEDEPVPSTNPVPLPPGNPSRGYIPDGVSLREYPDTLIFTLPGRRDAIVYYSWARVQKMGATERVRDVFLTGEGHSAWGQFNLLGRIRPSDGFISLSKEYTAGDRGKWLYRAYMVGNANGHLTGRWRDTLSPAHVHGYEGTWVASRRR